MLQSSVRVGDDGLAVFSFFIDGKELQKNCLCYLFCFSKTKLDKQSTSFVVQNGYFNFDVATHLQSQIILHGNNGTF